MVQPQRLLIHYSLPIHTYILQCQEVESDKLFSSHCEDYHQLHWQFKKLSKQVKLLSKELGIKVEKLNHLRQSRISIWVKVEGIRRAQYLAGFRRVMCAERYRKADMKDLKDQVLK